MLKTHALSKAVNKFNSKLNERYIPALIIKKEYNNGYLVKDINNKISVVDVNDIKTISLELQKIILENHNFIVGDE